MAPESRMAQFFRSSTLKSTVFSSDWAVFAYWLLQGGVL